MPSPITGADFTDYDPQADLCDKLENLLRTSQKMKEWFDWAFTTAGAITDEFAAIIGDAVQSSIGVQPGMVAWIPIGTVPSGWLVCNGAAVSRTDYVDLFNAIGTTFGTGDGATTFNLPDLQGRFLLGASSGFPLGATGGSSTHTLTDSEVPVGANHYHVVGFFDSNYGQDNHFITESITFSGNYNTRRMAFGSTSSPLTGTVTEGTTKTYGTRTDIAENEAATVAGHNNMPPYRSGYWLIKY